MPLEHKLPASGDMCVSVLSRLCTVMPNMYRVGISKVSPTPHSALEAPSSGAPKMEPMESEMPKLEITALGTV